jgi:hypothetical protein
LSQNKLQINQQLIYLVDVTYTDLVPKIKTLNFNNLNSNIACVHGMHVISWCKRSTIAQLQQHKDSLLTLGKKRYSLPSFLTLIKWKFKKHDV